MNNLSALELYTQISNKLLDSNWIENLSLNNNFTKKHIEDVQFMGQLNRMVNTCDYSCHAVLDLCKDMLSQLAKDHAPKDWLNYIYQFVRHKSFPHATEIPLNKQLDSACYLYLDVLNIVSTYQKFAQENTWQSKMPLYFLNEEEENNLEDPTEYRHFLTAFKANYIYEMMKLHKEISGHNTIDHICGAHYLALHIGRQLKSAGLPIDLGRVSGATAGHDIGKYGCTKHELKRVPYLHYYYTDQWFKKYNITYIGHIALNHSVWDLELENLSLESLILIYSDFRVKNRRDESGALDMYIYSLSDAFDIILEKLDNVDMAKQKRYKRVYAKLKDFENYMINIGIKRDAPLSQEESFLINEKKALNYSLMQGKDIIENVKYLAIYHNINLMYQLRNEYSLDAILELARSEKDWKKLREYLRIFEEYSTYLTQKQKLITIKFLYEKLVHPEDDIRKHCAELIGALIAMFDEDYRKEVPENVIMTPPDITSVDLLDQYVQLFIFPDHKIIPIHRAWIGHSLSIMVSSLFKHYKKIQDNQVSTPLDEYLHILLKYYNKEIYDEHKIQLYLLETIKYIPLIHVSEDIAVLFNFIWEMLKDDDNSLRLTALEVAYTIIPRLEANNGFIQRLSQLLIHEIQSSSHPSENYLKGKIVERLNLDSTIIRKYKDFCVKDTEKIPDMFLSNLKAATHWVIKRIQIEILLEHALAHPKDNSLHMAIHFCNLLKVSPEENIRNHAGEAILEILPLLTFEQKNEVAVELLRALELYGSQFAEYIPYYLGQLLLTLKPVELEEIVTDLSKRIKESDDKLSSLLLKTIGIAIAHYPKYKDLFHEKEKNYKDRLIKMLGILLNGLVNYNLRVKQAAFSIMGKEILGSECLSLEQKNEIFQLIAKKILNLVTEEKEEALLFLGNSASLNHIYRFISDYTFFKGEINLVSPEKVAFFPGTFDPFSLSHKEIVKSIRDLGFEVYLAIDEFSWSKQTLPHLLRKNIVNMSIADELNVYIYPEVFPTNIGNPMNLRILKENFPDSEVHIVIGSDVILNASSYRIKKEEYSIHTFPHLIIVRDHLFPNDLDHKALNSAIKKVAGKVQILNLPVPYEDISSTQIRNYIDENRDISNLVDPLAQKYIYEHGFYRREPQYKPLTQTLTINVEMIENFSLEIINEISSLFYENYEEAHNRLVAFTKKPSSKLLIIRDIKQNGKILGFSAHHWVKLDMLYHELKDLSASEHIRKHSVGKMVLIDGIYMDKGSNFENLEQIILTETLASCLAMDYEYAIFKNIITAYSSKTLEEILQLQGFIKLPDNMDENPIFTVNMSSPCTLNLDVDTIIKEPFTSNSNVLKAVMYSRKRLQQALTKMYPGQLILSFDRKILYEGLIRKICAVNNVPTRPLKPRTLGPSMCVPFGIMLNRYIIPNTVTKALHIEKMFFSHMKSFKMGPFPYYLDLELQVKMLRSFKRPIILVDDILHKGYRNNFLHPLLNKEGVQVEKIIVGILSARGKELMDRQNRKIDSVYYIPKLKAWFNENIMYPFMGGDTLWRDIYPQRNLVPSINLILPYTSPTFINSVSKDSIYHLSKVCIENAMEILTVIENEYHEIHERTLTLGSLGEVFISPRCPDQGENMIYDLNLSPSHYLKSHLEQLDRLEHIILHR